MKRIPIIALLLCILVSTSVLAAMAEKTFPGDPPSQLELREKRITQKIVLGKIGSLEPTSSSQVFQQNGKLSILSGTAKLNLKGTEIQIGPSHSITPTETGINGVTGEGFTIGGFPEKSIPAGVKFTYTTDPEKITFGKDASGKLFSLPDVGAFKPNLGTDGSLTVSPRPIKVGTQPESNTIEQFITNMDYIGSTEVNLKGTLLLQTTDGKPLGGITSPEKSNLLFGVADNGGTLIMGKGFSTNMDVPQSNLKPFSVDGTGIAQFSPGEMTLWGPFSSTYGELPIKNDAGANGLEHPITVRSGKSAAVIEFESSKGHNDPYTLTVGDAPISLAGKEKGFLMLPTEGGLKVVGSKDFEVPAGHILVKPDNLIVSPPEKEAVKIKAVSKGLALPGTDSAQKEKSLAVIGNALFSLNDIYETGKDLLKMGKKVGDVVNVKPKDAATKAGIGEAGAGKGIVVGSDQNPYFSVIGTEFKIGAQFLSKEELAAQIKDAKTFKGPLMSGPSRLKELAEQYNIGNERSKIKDVRALLDKIPSPLYRPEFEDFRRAIDSNDIEGIKKFQEKIGTVPDGMIGKKTLDAARATLGYGSDGSKKEKPSPPPRSSGERQREQLRQESQTHILERIGEDLGVSQQELQSEFQQAQQDLESLKSGASELKPTKTKTIKQAMEAIRLRRSQREQSKDPMASIRARVEARQTAQSPSRNAAGVIAYDLYKKYGSDAGITPEQAKKFISDPPKNRESALNTYRWVRSNVGQQTPSGALRANDAMYTDRLKAAELRILSGAVSRTIQRMPVPQGAASIVYEDLNEDAKNRKVIGAQPYLEQLRKQAGIR